MEPSGAGNPLRDPGLRRRRPCHALLRAAFTHQQEPDALQQLGRRIHALGEEDVRARVAFVNFYFSRKKDGRSLRGKALDLLDELGTVEIGHDEVAEYQVDAAALKD